MRAPSARALALSGQAVARGTQRLRGSSSPPRPRLPSRSFARVGAKGARAYVPSPAESRASRSISPRHWLRLQITHGACNHQLLAPRRYAYLHARTYIHWRVTSSSSHPSRKQPIAASPLSRPSCYLAILLSCCLLAKTTSWQRLAQKQPAAWLQVEMEMAVYICA